MKHLGRKASISKTGGYAIYRISLTLICLVLFHTAAIKEAYSDAQSDAEDSAQYSRETTGSTRLYKCLFEVTLGGTTYKVDSQSLVDLNINHNNSSAKHVCANVLIVEVMEKLAQGLLSDSWAKTCGNIHSYIAVIISQPPTPTPTPSAIPVTPSPGKSVRVMLAG